MIIPLNEKDIALDPRAQGIWCTLPYPNHPKGCPNFGKKRGCPPQSHRFLEIVKPPFFLIAEPFDIEAQAQRMKDKHHNWSERQCRNLLYWQKKVVKNLKEEALSFIESQREDMIILEVPEATGVNVFKTCENIGIILERNPRKIIWKVMLIGKRLSKADSNDF